MQSVRHCSKPREIVVSSIPDDGLLGDGSGQPVFEGFSDSQADRNRPRANHQISVLQAAKRGLLGRLTSSCHLVPGGRLRRRSLQLCLRESWDFVDESVLVAWTNNIRSNLQWWSDASNILAGVSLATPHTDHHFWFDASDQGWGAHVGDQFVSGQWQERFVCQSISGSRGPFAWPFSTFSVSSRGRRSGCSPTTPHLWHIFASREELTCLLNEEAQLLLRWAESHRFFFCLSL